MNDRNNTNSDPVVLYPPSKREQRRNLPALIRVAAIAFLGALLALASFYMLRKLGY